MFRTGNGTDPQAVMWLDFPLRDITGRWVSPEGAPAVRIFRNGARKNGGLWLEFTYNNPQAVYSRPVKDVFGTRYFDLYGRVGIAYDGERDMLLLSLYGGYSRADEERATN
ncbi:hypothetical protein [Limibacterium fermenti]|uniref:hypothetical protein n=1 Tax=Limibacterium fermenti TaxID=3229863 RepID=UPI003A610004